MGKLYDRVHGIVRPAQSAEPLKRAPTDPPLTSPPLCVKHGEQGARLGGRRICWPCHVLRHTRERQPLRR